MKGICILGATGSIGISTLDVAASHPQKYKLVALSANSQVELLFEQCQQYQPEYAVMANEKAAEELETKLKSNRSSVQVLSGIEGLEKIASLPQVDYVMAAIVGAAGLKPTLAAARAGKRILLANKEALVMSGDLFMREVEKHNAILLPVDSEHNAIFQSLPQATSNAKANLSGVREILLTGSGGPFLKDALSSLSDKTPDQACAHPNWDMGRKISVDSATMMNKGLELIEACYLFNVGVEKIKIVIHPQSIIHSMVSYLDGSVIAQMGNPDMRTPIAHCLAWPARIDAGVEPLDFYQLTSLEFQQPDFERFPCLEIAYESISLGLKGGPCVLNAANEIAVEAFLNGEIKFTEIHEVIQETFYQTVFKELATIESVLEVDAQTRELALSIIKERK